MEAGPLELALVVIAGLAVLIGAVALVLALRARATARREVAAARAESADLLRRLEQLEAGRQPRPAAPRPVHVAVPDPVPGEPVEVAATLPAPVFTDMVLRESVIRLASLTHGVRRALAPEQRNRVRFAVRQETKRSRKQRRSDLKAALREMQARERAAAAGAARPDLGEDAA